MSSSPAAQGSSSASASTPAGATSSTLGASLLSSTSTPSILASTSGEKASIAQPAPQPSQSALSFLFGSKKSATLSSIPHDHSSTLDRKDAASPRGAFLNSEALAFETENKANKFLNFLRAGNTKDFVTFMEDREGVLLVPQSNCLEEMSTFTTQFLRAHTLLRNPDNSSQFSTASGTYGVIEQRRDDASKFLCIISPVVPINETFNPLTPLSAYFNVIKSAFENFQIATRIQIIREGEVIIKGVKIKACIIAQQLPADTSTPIIRIKAASSPIVLPHSSGPVPQVKDLVEGFTNSPTKAPLFPDEPNTPSHPSASLAAADRKKEVQHRLSQIPEIVPAFKQFIKQFNEKAKNWQVKEMSDKVRDYMKRVFDWIIGHPTLAKPPLDDDSIDDISEWIERFILSRIYQTVFHKLPKEPDQELYNKLSRLSAFITPKHLDIKLNNIPPQSLELAKTELRKVNDFKAPRDKMVCIFNCCKVLYKLLKLEVKSETSLDDLLPLLLYTVIKSNPPMLHSNVEYISYFRDNEKMKDETGYYFTCLGSAVAYLSNLKASDLKVDPAIWIKYMEGPPPEEHQHQLLLSIGDQQWTSSPALVNSAGSHLGVHGGSTHSSRSSSPKPPVDFLTCSVSDLHPADVLTLLEEYRSLHHQHTLLKQKLASLTNTPSLDPTQSSSTSTKHPPLLLDLSDHKPNT